MLYIYSVLPVVYGHHRIELPAQLVGSTIMLVECPGSGHDLSMGGNCRVGEYEHLQ